MRRVLDAADVSDDLRFEAGYILADTLRLLGRYDEAWELAGAATVVAERHDAVLGTDDLQGRVRQLRGNIRWASGDWEAALVEYRGALISLERGHHPERVAETRMAVGNAQRHLARYDEALRSYRVAASTFRELGRLSMVGKCENNIAITHYYKGNWRAASEHFERFLRILERTGELIERARLHNNLGTLYRDRGYLDRSRELLEEGLDVARRCGARRLEATALGNLGETLLRQGALDEAAECLEMTVALSRELGALDEELEAKRRQLELALERDDGSFDEAVALTTAQQAETADVKLEAANVLRLVAQARLRAGDPSGADEVIGDAKQLLAGSGVALEMLRVRRVEAQVLAASGRVEEALSLLEDVLERLERMDAGWDLSETAGVMADLVRGPGQEDEPVRLTSSHLAAITRFATRAAQVEDKQAFLDDALRRIMEVIPADRGVVVTIDEGGRATAKAVRHRSDDAPDDAEVEFSRSICAQALSERRSVFVPVASAAAEFRSISSVGRLGLRTVMATPISREGHARGVLYLDSSTPCDKELEGAVALMEALAAIVGAGLVHAEMAEEARQRSEGLAVLVHELKAPITTTYGYLQLLRMDADELPEDMQSCLDVAHTELARLKRMVADIGKLSRLETHDTLHTAVQIHVPKLLRTVVRNLTAQWGAKGLDVAVEADDKLAHVIGDRDQLVQVITNLLTNAIKFTPDRGRIWLRAREVLRRETTELGPMLDPFGGNTVDGRPVSEIEISVQDSGPGIPPGAFEKIFALFGQSGGTKTRQKGMGIGLAVARHLVRRHGGRIWAENAMTGGAVFTFTLPVVRTSAYI